MRQFISEWCEILEAAESQDHLQNRVHHERESEGNFSRDAGEFILHGETSAWIWGTTAQLDWRSPEAWPETEVVDRQHQKHLQAKPLSYAQRARRGLVDVAQLRLPEVRAGNGDRPRPGQTRDPKNGLASSARAKRTRSNPIHRKSKEIPDLIKLPLSSQKV